MFHFKKEIINLKKILTIKYPNMDKNRPNIIPLITSKIFSKLNTEKPFVKLNIINIIGENNITGIAIIQANIIGNNKKKMKMLDNIIIKFTILSPITENIACIKFLIPFSFSTLSISFNALISFAIKKGFPKLLEISSSLLLSLYPLRKCVSYSFKTSFFSVLSSLFIFFSKS